MPLRSHSFFLGTSSFNRISRFISNLLSKHHVRNCNPRYADFSMVSYDAHSKAFMNATDGNLVDVKESKVKPRALADVDPKVRDILPSEHDPKSPLLDHNHKIPASPGICTSCHLSQQPPSPQHECCPNHYLITHSTTDACCGNFCPDIEVPHKHPCCGGECCHRHYPQDRPYQPPHRRHSHLNQQQWPEVLDEKAEGK